MKITFLLFFLSLHCLFAGNVLSQEAKVTIHKSNIPLETVLNEIESQTPYLFIYSRNDLDVTRRVSVSSNSKEVRALLEEIFAGTNITYEMEGSHIILLPAAIAARRDEQNRIEIGGKVTDETGEPLMGVAIQIKGTSSGTISDLDGNFRVQVNDRNDILIFSFVGFTSQEQKVGDRSVINIIMEEDNQLLNEVVIVGYGTTSKRKLVSSISTIPVKDIESLPSSSIVNNLGGRTPGVIVAGQGGGPGVNSSLSIRGGGTPIVVIDGVVSEYTDFVNINPSDIENLSILKDASAAAVYGARAGNGIILITTKKGSNKPLTINYDFTYSLSQPTVSPKKISSYERAGYLNEAYMNDNLEPIYSAEVLEKYRTGSDPYNYPNVDWQDLCLNNFAPEVRHNISFNGGDNRNGYYASLSYYNQGSLYVYDTNSMERYNARLNLTNTFEKIGLKTTTSVSANMYERKAPWYDYYSIWSHIQNKNPWDLAYNDMGMYALTTDHPLAEMDPRSGYNNREYKNLNGQFKAEWLVPYVEGLKLTSGSNYYLNTYKRKAWRDMAPQAALGTTTPALKNAPRLEEEFLQGHSFTQQLLADYDRKIGDFSLGLLFGYEYTKSFESNLTGTRENYQLEVDQIIAGPTENMTNGANEAEYGRAGYIGRLQVDYKAKYLLEANFRRDGSDWFPKDKRWGNFYSFSGGWVASEERFMENLRHKDILNLFKVRASYGIVGLDGELTKDYDNDSPFKLKRFSYVPGYNLEQRGYIINNSYVQGFREGELVSPDITWYTSHSLNLGFDFESLNHRLSGGFEYFYVRTTGYLTSPSNVGYTDPLGIALPRIKSDGAERRHGYEVYLGYKDRIGDLEYGLTFNYTYYNKIWENNPTESEDILKNPRRRNTHVYPYQREGYKAIGFYKDEEDIKNSPRPLNSVNLRPGDIKYADIDGNGIIDDGDKVRIGESDSPRSTYGFQIDLNYKGAFLNVLFQGSGKRNFYLGDMVRAQEGVVYQFQTDYWTPDNTDALFPRLISNKSFNGNNNYHDSDFWLVDASYFRLKSMQIGYDLKYKVLKNIGIISTARITLSGTNLFTISKALDYYYDPESAGDGNNYYYPYQRVYSLTLNLGF